MAKKRLQWASRGGVAIRTAVVACLWGILVAGAMAKPAFPLQKEDVVVFLGGVDMVRAQKAGYLELGLSERFEDVKPRFRDLAWEGDTVFHQTTVRERWRREAFGDLAAQLKRVGATVVVLQFGKMESLEGEEGLEEFGKGLKSLLEQINKQTSRIAILSPTPFGRTSHPLRPAMHEFNADLERYVTAVKDAASNGNYDFVDLFHPLLERFDSGKMSLDGVQISDAAHLEVANVVMNQLKLKPLIWSRKESARLAVVEKHRLWYEYWRPANWKCLFGDDSRRIFSIGGKGLPTFQDEWKLYPGLIEKAEAQVWAVLNGERFIPPRPAPPQPGPKDVLSPQEAEKTFTAIDGFAVNLFASEHEGVLNPLSMRWDGRGRMYVACTMVYPQIVPGSAPNDTIVLLQDTDGDGRADRSSIFAEGLNIPTGMEIGSDGVYVGQGTELLLLQDTDGDDKADKRTVLLSGFGNGDSHQTSNGFVWSPGGELYFSQGDGIESRVETPYGVSSLFQAGVFRLRPGELELHGLLDDFMGPGNPWGVVFDNFGQSFVIDGAGGISYLTPARLPVHHRLRLPRIGKPGGYCGVDMIGTPHLPDELQGDFLLGDFKRNRISRYRLADDGAGFKVDWKSPLAQSSDRNFRPVDVRVGPDGAVYVADWYNPLTCHQDDFYRHPDRDELRGRIWRIAPEKGLKPQKFDLRKESIGQLVARLGVRDRWMLQAVKRELQRRDFKAVRNELENWVLKWRKEKEGSSELSRGLIEALGAFEHIHVFAPHLVVVLLDIDDPRARAYATRVVGRWHARFDQGVALGLLSKMVNDEHPRVRMEAILAAGMIPDPQAVEIVARSVDRPSDRWIDYASVQAVHYLKDRWLPAFKRGELDFEGNSRHLAMVLERGKVKEAASTLVELAKSGDLTSDSRSSILRGILAVGGAGDLRQLLIRDTFGEEDDYDADAQATMLAELRQVSASRKIKPEGDLSELLGPLLASDEAALRVAAIRLIGQWEVGALRESLVGLSRSSGVPEAVRLAAIDAVGRLGEGREEAILLGLTLEGHPTRIKLSAVKALGRLNPPLGAELTARWVAGELPGRGELVDDILARKGGDEELIKVFEEAPLDEEDATWLSKRLETTGRLESGLVEFLNKQVSRAVTVPDYSMAKVKELAASAMKKGSAQRGEDVFRSPAANCYSCHQVAGVGGWIGPELTAVGSAIPLERLVEEVVWPRRLVKEGFSLVEVTTREGDVIQGYEQKHRNAGKELLLNEFGTQQVRKIPLDQVEQKENLGSAMPDTAVAGLSRQELDDLIRFLTEVGVKPEFSKVNPKALRHWEKLLESPGVPNIEELLDEGDWLKFYGRMNGMLSVNDFDEDTIYLKSPIPEEKKNRVLKLKNVGSATVWAGGVEVARGSGGGYRIGATAAGDWLVIRIPLRQIDGDWFGAEW